MIEEIQFLMDKYRAWLKDKTALRQVENHVEITTPFLDRHNDYIQIYAKKENGGYMLSDDGYTIQDIELSGCSLDSPKRQSLLKATLAGFGVQNANDALTVKVTADNFSIRKHNLIQAILATNDLFYLAQPYVANFFLEDVEKWLDQLEIRYTPKVNFTGKSGYEHRFDFAIPKSKRAPERILKVINHPTKEAALSLAFSWVDTKEVRSVEARAYAILNDREQHLSGSVIDALKNYEVTAVAWNEKDKRKEELAA